MKRIYIPAALMVVFLTTPLIALFVKTPAQAYSAGMFSPATLSALKLSFISATVSAAIVFILGTPLAYCFAVKKSQIQSIAKLTVELPAVLPPSVAGIVLLMAFGRHGIMGGMLNTMDLNIPFTTLALIVAQVFVSAGYYIKVACSAFESIEPAVREESLSIGLNEWGMLTTIYIPISIKALISGGISAWSMAMGEFGATMIFAGNLAGKTRTMPLAIYTAMQGDLNTAMGLPAAMVAYS